MTGPTRYLQSQDKFCLDVSGAVDAYPRDLIKVTSENALAVASSL